MSEQESQPYSHNRHHSNDNPYCSSGAFRDEREHHVHAKNTGDKRQRKYDRRNQSKNLHDFVRFICLHRVERLRETLDQIFIVLGHIPYLLVVVEDVAPVVFHILQVTETSNLTCFEGVEHSQLRFEDSVHRDDILSRHTDSLDDLHLFRSEKLAVYQLKIQPHLF